MNINIERIETLLRKLKSEDQWGTYYMGKFYFTIATNKKRSEVGLTDDKKELSPEMQLHLQQENFPALFHEYIHYLHELSTVIGNIGISLDLSAKAVFSNWLDPNIKSSMSNGINKKRSDLLNIYSKVIITKDVLFGNANEILNGKFIEVKNIEYIEQNIYLLEEITFIENKLSIPKIHFTQLIEYKTVSEHLLFGKYFLYEGLAYELDRIVDMQVKKLTEIKDYCKGTEYTVLRRLSQYLFPDIEKQTYLCIASLSLQYIDCGRTFIKMVERVRENCKLGFSQEEIVKILKEETSSLLKNKQNDFNDAQDEYKNVFMKRKLLFKAFEYLSDNIKKLYSERIENPTFEVDYVFQGKYGELLNTAQICDYMYLFTDDEEYMRDFIGTSIDLETSSVLKTLLTYDHYYTSHKIFSTTTIEQQESTCPFFYCCDLPLRKTHTNICKTKPWRIFEISSNSDNQYCWYGQGVLETKGINEI